MEGAYIRVEIWRQWDWPFSPELLAEGDVCVGRLLKNHCTLPALDSRRAHQAVEIPLQSINADFRASMIVFPETTSAVHWRQLCAHHSTQKSALLDLLYLLQRHKAKTITSEEKWPNYCDTETLGILGELLRKWCLGTLPSTKKTRHKDRLLDIDGSDDGESEESGDSSDEEDEDFTPLTDEEALSPMDSSTKKDISLSNIVVKIWKMLDEISTMHFKLAAIAFHLFLIDIFPLAFENHPKHAFFLLRLMNPYFPLENTHTRQFIIFYAALLSDTTMDFIGHYEERRPILDAYLEHTMAPEKEEKEIKKSVQSPSSSEPLVPLLSSGELEINRLDSSAELARVDLEVSLSSETDIAPRRARKAKGLDMKLKESVSKRKSAKLERRETKLSLRMTEQKRRDQSLRERARKRIIIALWQNLKYFDPVHLPIILKTKVIDSLNAAFRAAQILPGEIIGLMVDAVKFIGPSYASQLDSKHVLANMSESMDSLEDFNLKLRIMETLGQFAPLPGVSSIALSETAVFNAYISEFQHHLSSSMGVAGNNTEISSHSSIAPTAILIANKFLEYLKIAPDHLKKLSREYPPTVSALLELLVVTPTLTSSILECLPSDPSVSFLLQTNIISVYKRYFLLDNPVDSAENQLLHFINKIITTSFVIGSNSSSSSPDVKQSPLPEISNDELFGISCIFPYYVQEIRKSGVWASQNRLRLVLQTLLDAKGPILEILVLRDNLLSELMSFITRSDYQYSANSIKIEVLVNFLTLLRTTHERRLWLMLSERKQTDLVDFESLSEAAYYVFEKGSHNVIKIEGHGRTFQKAYFDPQHLEDLAYAMDKMLNGYKTEWKATVSHSLEYWKSLTFLFGLVMNSTDENFPKFHSFLRQLKQSQPRSTLVYYTLLESLIQALKKTSEQTSFFRDYYTTMIQLLVPTQIISNPSVAVDWPYNTSWKLDFDYFDKNGKSALKLDERSSKGSLSWSERPFDILTEKDGALFQDYVELFEKASTKPAILATDLDSSWADDKTTKLPSTLFDFTFKTNSDIFEATSSSSPDGIPELFDPKKTASTPLKTPLPVKLEDIFESNLFGDDEELFSAPSSASTVSNQSIASFVLPPVKIAELSRVVMKWLDLQQNCFSFDHTTEIVTFLAIQDVWFRERLFSHKTFWSGIEKAYFKHRPTLLHLIGMFIRTESVQRLLTDPKHILQFAAFLQSAMIDSPSDIPPAVVYNILSLWISNESLRECLKRHIKTLLVRSLSLPSFSSAQRKSLAKLWSGVMEPLVKSSTLSESFEIIHQLISHSYDQDKIAERLYITKLNQTLAEIKSEGKMVDLDTSKAFATSYNSSVSPSVLRSAIRLWRPGNAMKDNDLARLLSGNIRSISQLSTMLSNSEMSLFQFQTSFSANPDCIWSWIEYEKRDIESSQPSTDPSSLPSKLNPSKEADSNASATSSSAPPGLHSNSNNVSSSISSATMSSIQPSSTQLKSEKASTKEVFGSAEFILRRFYQAEFVAAIYHARSKSGQEFFPPQELKAASSPENWADDPLLQLLVCAFTGAENSKTPEKEYMHKLKGYATHVIPYVVENRAFFVNNHPLVILAILQCGVLNSHLHLEYELYSCLSELYTAVEFERMRVRAILKVIAHCASRHPAELCERMSNLPQLLERAFMTDFEPILLEALGIVNAISRQPLLTSNDVLFTLICMECQKSLHRLNSSPKLKDYVFSVIFSIRFFGSAPKSFLSTPRDVSSSHFHSSSKSHSKGSKKSSPRKLGKEIDMATQPLLADTAPLLLDEKGALELFLLDDTNYGSINSVESIRSSNGYSTSPRSHDSEHIRLSNSFEKEKRPSSSNYGAIDRGMTKINEEMTPLVLDESERDEWEEVLLVAGVDPAEMLIPKEDATVGTDIWRMQFAEILGPNLRPGNHLTPLAHIIANTWIDYDESAAKMVLSTLNLRVHFDIFLRSHGIVIRSLEQQSNFEAESMFWTQIASGQSDEGEINNGPIIGNALIALALLPVPQRRHAFFSTLVMDSLLTQGVNMLSEAVRTIPRWQRYHQTAGLIHLSAALLLYRETAEDLIGATAFKTLAEKWIENINIISVVPTPVCHYVAQKLGVLSKYRYRNESDYNVKKVEEIEVDFMPKLSESHLNMSDHSNVGIAFCTLENTIYAAPYRVPIHAVLQIPLNGSEVLASGNAELVVTINVPFNQTYSYLRVGFATKSGLSKLDGRILGEVPGTYSAEQRSGILLASGATIMPTRRSPSHRCTTVMRINFEKQIISFSFSSNDTSSICYHIWNFDTSETLFPVISFENPSCVTVSHHWTPSVSASKPIISDFEVSVPKEAILKQRESGVVSYTALEFHVPAPPPPPPPPSAVRSVAPPPETTLTRDIWEFDDIGRRLMLEETMPFHFSGV